MVIIEINFQIITSLGKEHQREFIRSFLLIDCWGKDGNIDVQKTNVAGVLFNKERNIGIC